MAEAVISRPENLPVGPIRRHGIGWWGVGTLIASEAALFSYLLFAYFYTGATAQPGWLLEPTPSLKLALPNTVILLGSTVAAWLAARGVLHQRRAEALVGFACAFVMGTVFVIVQWFEWRTRSYRIGTSSYGSLYL